MKKKIITRTLSTLALIGCVYFIFHNSMQVGVVSEVRSEDATNFLRRILGYIMAGFLEDDHYVRKLAHITEFLCLGVVTTINLIVWDLSRKRDKLLGCFFGIMIASLDETIQLFVPGRSGKVSDVFIDCIGFLLGFFICLLFALWYNKSQCAKKRITNN